MSDVFIVSAARTPIGKYFCQSFELIEITSCHMKIRLVQLFDLMQDYKHVFEMPLETINIY